MRQLVWMTEGRDRYDWSLVSALMALIANCHRSGRTEFKSDDFNPTLTKTDRRKNALLVTDENVGIMRNEFREFFRA